MIDAYAKTATGKKASDIVQLTPDSSVKPVIIKREIGFNRFPGELVCPMPS